MKISFNGKWKYQVDPLNAGMKESWWELTWIINQYAKLEEINLPNNWNRLPELKRYEGIVWFFYSFELKEDQKNLESSELFLQFKAANYETHLWINGVDYGVHEGNFLPFRFRINSEAINYKESNYIAVRVENLRKKDRIPTSSRDWFNYGGIYRDIDFLILNKYRINWIGIKSNIHMRGSATVNVHYEFKVPKKRINLSESKNHEIKWNLYYLGDLSSQNQERRQKKVLLKSGSHLTSYKDRKDNFSIQLDEAQVWSPANPRLYEIELTLTESEELYITRFGIREVIIKDSRLFLNRKSISLQGVNLHEELVPYGRSIPIEERRKDVITIKQMGFNALRTAHYPHDESIYDICDEEGLLVLEEIPVYWGINFSSKKMLALAARMLRTMIRRDFNHPSIIMWSAGNEIPITETACFQFMAHLLRYSRSLDDTRLTSCVLEFWTALVLPKAFTKEVDILCCNQYLGWYYLSAYNLNLFMDVLYQRSNKLWFITEFGGGAKYGFHDTTQIPDKYSEERQSSILGHSIKVFNSKNYVAGWFIWIYRDFCSHKRLNKFQEGFNRKGIVSEKNQQKLIARSMPKLVNQELENIRHHKVANLILYAVLYPLIRLASIITALLLTKFSDTGDKYYVRKPESES